MDFTEQAAILNQLNVEPDPPGDFTGGEVLKALSTYRHRKPPGPFAQGRSRARYRVAKMILSERGLTPADVLACRDLPLSDLDLLAALAVGITPQEMNADLPDREVVRAMAALRGIRLPDADAAEQRRH